MPPSDGLAPAKARAAAARVLRAHFGAPVRTLEPLAGGLNNLVFRARAGRSKVVVRLHAEAGKVHDYLKEQWAI